LKQADAGRIRAGHPQLRAILMEAAHRLQRCDQRWKEFGLQLKQRGKPASLVAAAVANRGVRWLHKEWRGFRGVGRPPPAAEEEERKEQRQGGATR